MDQCDHKNFANAAEKRKIALRTFNKIAQNFGAKENVEIVCILLGLIH